MNERQFEQIGDYIEQKGPLSQNTYVCPDCGVNVDVVRIVDEEVQYGPNGPKTTVAVPTWICEKCKFQWTGHEAEELRDNALANMLKRPAIKAVKRVIGEWMIRIDEKRFDGDVLLDSDRLIDHYSGKAVVLNTKFFFESSLNHIIGRYNRTFDTMADLMTDQLNQIYEEIKNIKSDVSDSKGNIYRESREEMMERWHKKWYDQ